MKERRAVWAAGSLTPAAGDLLAVSAVSISSPAVEEVPGPGVVSALTPAVAETRAWPAVWWSARNVRNPGALQLTTATGDPTLLSGYRVELNRINFPIINYKQYQSIILSKLRYK